MSMTVYDIAFQNLSALDELESSRLHEARSLGSTIVVPGSCRALTLASIVDQTNSQLVIVTNEDGEMIGTIVPGAVKTRVSNYLDCPVIPTFSAALQLLATDPTGKVPKDRQEWLRSERTYDFWCEKGRHYTDENPCSIHGR